MDSIDRPKDGRNVQSLWIPSVVRDESWSGTAHGHGRAFLAAQNVKVVDKGYMYLLAFSDYHHPLQDGTSANDFLQTPRFSEELLAQLQQLIHAKDIPKGACRLYCTVDDVEFDRNQRRRAWWHEALRRWNGRIHIDFKIMHSICGREGQYMCREVLSRARLVVGMPGVFDGVK